jgi:hypothetical protein
VKHVKNYTALADFSPNKDLRRMAIFLCDFQPVTGPAIQATYNWLCEGNVSNPPYACFVGKYGSQGDEEMDWISIKRELAENPGPQIMTTWHDEETVEDVTDIPDAFSYPSLEEAIWIIIGHAITPFEQQCVKALNERYPSNDRQSVT